MKVVRGLTEKLPLHQRTAGGKGCCRYMGKKILGKCRCTGPEEGTCCVFDRQQRGRSCRTEQYEESGVILSTLFIFIF